MGVRLTGFSTPLGGFSWEYTRKEKSLDFIPIAPEQKIKVFISSRCGEPKYDTIRTELKKKIEATALADVYMFEEKEASTLTAGEHYRYALKDSDICIFLIDNADGISSGVQAEIDVVQKHKIKALYYFCDENSAEKTILEKSLMGSTHEKAKTIHKFSDLSKSSAKALIDDIISIYRYYCKGEIISRQEEDSGEFQQVNIAEIEKIQRPTVPKTILNNIEKCKDYILRFIADIPHTETSDNGEKDSEVDKWCAQFLPILFEGESVTRFNVGMFLEMLSKHQSDEFHRVVQIRWQAIQAYFSGEVKKCLEHLQKALEYAKKSHQPIWVIKDILIDLRNQSHILDSINNCFSVSDAQKELTDSNEEVYYPTLDRINESLYEKYVEEIFKEKTKSPYSITLGGNLSQYCELLASGYVVSMYNGSLTHILLTYEKIRNFLFVLLQKYDDWCFRCNMLKLAVYEGNEKEIKGILNSYPEILNKMSATDAAMIMCFCKNQPIKYKQIISQLAAFGVVGYYLSDQDFEKYEAYILSEIAVWINEPNPIFLIGQSVFQSLSGVASRISQDKLADLCCMFIDKQHSNYFIEMFKFMAAHIDLRKMKDESSLRLIEHIVKIFEDEKQCELMQYASQFLYMFRRQNKDITEGLDKKVAEFFPVFYNGLYQVNTTDNETRDFPIFLQHCIQQINISNEKQGKNGRYFGHGTRDIATVRSILVWNDNKYTSELMDSIILTVADTLLISKEEISTKLDAISLLTCIVKRYPDDYTRNKHIFQKIFQQKDSIEAADCLVLSSNIDSISLKICLQFLFSAMEIDTYAEILELMPYIQKDIPTTISVSRMIVEYLETTDDTQLPSKIESIILQNVLQWLSADRLEIRFNALKILLYLSRNPENGRIVNRQLISLVDSDNVYIKNYILQNMYAVDAITEITREYIVSKCENDACYMVRRVCSQIQEQCKDRQFSAV